MTHISFHPLGEAHHLLTLLRWFRICISRKDDEHEPYIIEPCTNDIDVTNCRHRVEILETHVWSRVLPIVSETDLLVKVSTKNEKKRRLHARL